MIAPNSQANASVVYLAHTCVVAALATAGFMVMTAVDLGPMGPMVIAQALYLAAFALLVELGLASRAVVVAAKRALARRHASMAQEAQ